MGNREVTLLDTPGHVDFSAEMERTLQVLDAAVLVISGADGVQGHVETLWKLLKYYRDSGLSLCEQDGSGRDGPGKDSSRSSRNGWMETVWISIRKRRDYAAFAEEAAMSDEKLLEEYLESGSVDRKLLKKAIADRKLFPCFFGSALKIQGVEELLKGLETYASTSPYRKSFSARVYKISRDEAGNRLTHLKVTGGVLKVKMPLTNRQGRPGGERDLGGKSGPDPALLRSRLSGCKRGRAGKHLRRHRLKQNLCRGRSGRGGGRKSSDSGAGADLPHRTSRGDERS